MNKDAYIFECLCRGISQSKWDSFNDIEKDAYIRNHPTSMYAKKLKEANSRNEIKRLSKDLGDCILRNFTSFLSNNVDNSSRSYFDENEIRNLDDAMRLYVCSEKHQRDIQAFCKKHDLPKNLTAHQIANVLFGWNDLNHRLDTEDIVSLYEQIGDYDKMYEIFDDLEKRDRHYW